MAATMTAGAAAPAAALDEYPDDRAEIIFELAMRLSKDEQVTARGEYGLSTRGDSVLQQRREARKRLGLPRDDLDAALVEPSG